MLWTNELQATIDFYTNILNFVCNNRNEDWGWASLSNETIEIMIAKPNAHTPFYGPVFTGSFYFQIDNVDALWKELKDKTKVAYEMETFDWGMKEFAIFDNNGYMLQFGQDVNE